MTPCWAPIPSVRYANTLVYHFLGELVDRETELQAWTGRYNRIARLPATVGQPGSASLTPETDTAMTAKADPLIGKLIEKLEHEDPLIRRNAAGALRFHGVRAAGAIAALTARLNDEDAGVRAEAERALDRLRTAAA